jgi:aminoglycoside phosphotransferase family enzyme/predicted kinase
VIPVGAQVAETHISVLFFVGDRAYKLKKPVDLGFLDFSTRELRLAACRREVELNRRLAPDVYLGVADVTDEHGELADHLVVMRRMPAERRLATLVAGSGSEGEPAACVDAVAELVGRFHATAATGGPVDAAGSPEAVRAHWEDSFAALVPFVGTVLDGDVVARVEARVRSFLAGRNPLFARRVAEGHVVDGHGDLQAADVFCLDDGPRVLDCIEFDDALRHGDVLADAGFLAMDLERLGAPGLARRFLERWAVAAGPHGTPEARHAPLLHHYVAYRAHVRCKVTCLRLAQEEPGSTRAEASAAEARTFLDLCDRHLDAARVRLVLVGGAPGTGKSTVARGLGEARGWPVLRSDLVRKELAGLAPTDRSGAAGVGGGIYGPDRTDATYDELLERAAAHLEGGTTVVLDASWTDAEHRDRARRLAGRHHAEVVELRCEVRAEVAAARIRRRAELGADPSDADPTVAEALAARADPWPEAAPVDNSTRPEDAVAVALDLAGPG